MNNTPIVSFVVCVGETAEYALTTVKSLYTQDYANIEVLVYYCSPYLNENTLITPLLEYPIYDNIRLIVEKSDQPLSRAEAVRICAEKIHGEYVCFLKENSVFSSETTISKIVEAFHQGRHLDALVLPYDRKNAIKNQDPGCVIIDSLLYNYPRQAIVFQTNEARSVIDRAPNDIYELLPEAMLLQMQCEGKENHVSSIRNSAIAQKAFSTRNFIQHLTKRDTLELLKTYFITESSEREDAEHIERIETFYAKLNYYCALYNVTCLESKEEIQTLCLQELAREVDSRKDAYEKINSARKKNPATGMMKTKSAKDLFKKVMTKIYQSEQAIFFTLVLLFNLLLLKGLLASSTVPVLSCILWGVWTVSVFLFVFSLAQQGIARLKKFRAWLCS